jgi:charged multivesicular body protein 6
LVLKLKRFKEDEIIKLNGQLLGILEMIENIESEFNNIAVMNALKSGNSVLSRIHSEMSADDVAALLDETNEAIEVSLLLLCHCLCFFSNIKLLKQLYFIIKSL